MLSQKPMYVVYPVEIEHHWMLRSPKKKWGNIYFFVISTYMVDTYMVGTHSDIITFLIADHSNLSVGGEWKHS